MPKRCELDDELVGWLIQGFAGGVAPSEMAAYLRRLGVYVPIEKIAALGGFLASHSLREKFIGTSHFWNVDK